MVRLKTRYLVVEVAGAANARKLTLQKDDVAGLIRESIARNYGDYGVGLLQYAFQGTRRRHVVGSPSALACKRTDERTSCLQCSTTTCTRASRWCAARASSASSWSRRSCS